MRTRLKRIREKHHFKYMKMILVINCEQREFSDIWDQNSEYFIPFVYFVQLLNRTITDQLRKYFSYVSCTTKPICFISSCCNNKDRQTATV